MRRLILLLILPILACAPQNTSVPATPISSPSATSVTTTETSVLPTASPETPTSTTVPATDTPSSAATFPDPLGYNWGPVASDLERPVDLQPDGSGRLFIIEKAGRIRILQDGQLLEQPFLDIVDRVRSSGNEQGLLGLVFHPQYAQNGRFFVNYTDRNGDTVIARFQVTGDANLADANSEVKLLGVEQPFPNHNGGVLAFGPDGYLYAGLGDGGSGGDPFGNAQKTDVLLGKILRIDVESAEPYAVPPDNPFGNEVWAYGLRNPWRMSFDRLTGDLFIGDVGQGQYEEIDYLPAGSGAGTNFGWDYREGAHPFEGEGPAGMVDPIAEYSHFEGGCSVTGGFVYRGEMPEWNGIYLYGDYCTGIIWGLIQSNGTWFEQQLFDVNFTITSFAQDELGEIYALSDNGTIYKLMRR
jgi:glucose/arabinose dehydrogenase